jgi:tripartite-type tricarboxylate transporter receptor subunit TctC
MLSDRLGQPFIVENRPGGGTNIGTEAVVRSAPDGYTILLVAPANAINATLYTKLNYNFLRDIVPVAGIIRFGNVMEVTPSVPVKTVPEFIAYANMRRQIRARSISPRAETGPPSTCRVSFSR